MSNQHDAMVHDVLNVWRHEEIDKRRVSLLCCVGDRQALYLMDYAMAFDRFMCELYGQNDGEHSHSRDVSAWTERRSAWRWDRWADAAREQIGWLDGSEAADYGLTVGQLDRLKNKLRKCLQR